MVRKSCACTVREMPGRRIAAPHPLVLCALVAGLAGQLFCEGIPTAPPQVRALSPASRRRTGILVHGCHLQALGWSDIVFGVPEKQLLGRVAQAALLALEEDPVCIVFGTGGSHKDGKPEGEYTMDFLFENFGRLASFRAFEGVDLNALQKRMRACSVAEVKSLNTVEELREGGEIMLAKGADRIIIVSSPTHLPRCLRDATVAFQNRDVPFRNGIFACPSGTSYHGCTADDVAIVEPPHRGDRDVTLDKPAMHKLVAALYSLRPVERRDVLIELQGAIERRHKGWAHALYY